MSRFTRRAASTTTTSGAVSDAITQNALTVAGAAGLAGVGVMSVAVTATILPAQTICLTGAAAATLAAGHRMAQGKSLNPFAGTDKAAPAAESATPAKSETSTEVAPAAA